MMTSSFFTPGGSGTAASHASPLSWSDFSVNAGRSENACGSCAHARADRGGPVGEERRAREREGDAAVARVPADDVAREGAERPDAANAVNVGDGALGGPAVDDDGAKDSRLDRRGPSADEVGAVNGARGVEEKLGRRGELAPRPEERVPRARGEVTRDTDEGALEDRARLAPGEPTGADDAGGEVDRGEAVEGARGSGRRRRSEELEERFAADRGGEACDVGECVGERDRDRAVGEGFGDGERVGGVEGEAGGEAGEEGTGRGRGEEEGEVGGERGEARGRGRARAHGGRGYSAEGGGRGRRVRAQRLPSPALAGIL